MRIEIVWYFVKDSKVHKYPAPKKCKTKHTDEVLYFKPHPKYEKCDECF